MFGSALLTLTTLVAAVSAVTDFTTCCTVDPTTVANDQRQAWCRAQTNTCPLLCTNGQTRNNTCDPVGLTYNCTCLSGSGPGNISSYDQTLPSFECAEWRAQCTNAHPNDLVGQNFCQSFICGSRNASAQALGGGSSSTSASATATSSGTASGTASATNSAASISASRSAAGAAATAAVQLGKQYGTAALGVAGMALFGLAL